MTFETIALPAKSFHYTLPGFQPDLTPIEEESDLRTWPFEDGNPLSKLRNLITWRQVVGLDHTPLDPSTCAPPLQPPSLPIRDAMAERQQWRRILGALKSPDVLETMPRAVAQMLALLADYQQQEVTLLAYGLSEGGL
jgi:hypothetical protein